MMSHDTMQVISSMKSHQILHIHIISYTYIFGVSQGDIVSTVIWYYEALLNSVTHEGEVPAYTLTTYILHINHIHTPHEHTTRVHITTFNACTKTLCIKN